MGITRYEKLIVTKGRFELCNTRNPRNHKLTFFDSHNKHIAFNFVDDHDIAAIRELFDEYEKANGEFIGECKELKPIKIPENIIQDYEERCHSKKR